MVEIRIHGRGGGGVVPFARLLAGLRSSRVRSAQASVHHYAERVGAPVEASCRFGRLVVVDPAPTPEPDHVVVLDAGLPPARVRAGLAPGGWVILASDAAPDAFADDYPDQRVATVPAEALAREFGDDAPSSRVHAALVGAVGATLGFDLEDVLRAVDRPEFDDGHLDAASAAFDAVRLRDAPASPAATPRRSAAGGPEADGDRPGAERVPPCSFSCPAGNDVRGFLLALADDRVDDALETLLRTSPFPSICGRICPAPCVTGCSRRDLDTPVDVREMERLAGDRGDVRLVPAERREETVAVVGSGPAGLAAAYHLALLGYGVRIFEVSSRLGGTLRSAVPAFRLPAEVLDREIDRILDLGVEVVLGRVVDGSRLLKIAEDHEAVLVATGLQRLESLRLGHETDEGILQAVDLLDQVRRGRGPRFDGEEIVVVGENKTAFDAARTAVRLGAAAVRVVCAGSPASVPGLSELLRDAEEEGVETHAHLRPLRIRRGDGPGPERELVCLRTRPAEVTAGDATPTVEIPESEHGYGCDRVILALGRTPNLSIFPAGSEVREDERLLGLLPTPIYAVGDVATGAGTVADSVGGGRRAALRIHRALSGEDRTSPSVNESETGHQEVIRRRPPAHPHPLVQIRDSSSGPMLDPETRRHTFDEVRIGSADAGEAQRCLSCGLPGPAEGTFVVRREPGRQDLVFDYAYGEGSSSGRGAPARSVVYMRPS